MSLSLETNAFAAGMKQAPMTAGEIELIARKMRAMIIADGLATLIVGAGRTIGWIVRPLVAWWNRTQVYDELMSMDDRMLADIGISRADIPAVAAGRTRDAANGLGWHTADRVRRMPRPSLPLAHNDRIETPQVA